MVQKYQVLDLEQWVYQHSMVSTAASDEERFKVIDRVIELGCTYIDTADMYGDSEDLLGKYFKKYPQQRKKVIISILSKIVKIKLVFHW